MTDAKPRSYWKLFWMAVVVLVVLYKALGTEDNTPQPLRQSSVAADHVQAKEGSTIVFSGIVTEVGTGPVSGNPYFRVAGNGVRIKCYYRSGGSPPMGQSVTVRGVVTMWVDDAGGNVRPCSVL